MEFKRYPSPWRSVLIGIAFIITLAVVCGYSAWWIYDTYLDDGAIKVVELLGFE